MQLKWLFQVLNCCTPPLTVCKLFQFMVVNNKLIWKQQRFPMFTAKLMKHFIVAKLATCGSWVEKMFPSLKHKHQLVETVHSCIFLCFFSSIWILCQFSSLCCTFCMSGINVTLHGPGFAFWWYPVSVCVWVVRKTKEELLLCSSLTSSQWYNVIVKSFRNTTEKRN